MVYGSDFMGCIDWYCRYIYHCAEGCKCVLSGCRIWNSWFCCSM